MKNSNAIGGICLASAASIWGSMYVVSKYTLNYITPFTLLWFRYVIASGILVIMVLRNNELELKPSKITKGDLKLLLGIGFIGYFLSITFQFYGTMLSDAHTGALITSSTPAFVVIFAYLILKERITIKKVISLVVATIGVVVIIGVDIELDQYFWGCIILVGAAVTWALLSVFVKLATERIHTLLITTYSMIIALLFTTPFFIRDIAMNGMVINPILIMAILYLGIIATAGGFYLWNKGLELMQASGGSLFLFLQPVVGGILGYLMLGEELNYRFFIGFVLILIGVVIVTFQKEMDDNENNI